MVTPAGPGRPVAVTPWTSAPDATSARAAALPMKPVAPVTRKHSERTRKGYATRVEGCNHPRIDSGPEPVRVMPLPSTRHGRRADRFFASGYPMSSQCHPGGDRAAPRPLPRAPCPVPWSSSRPRPHEAACGVRDQELQPMARAATADQRAREARCASIADTQPVRTPWRGTSSSHETRRSALTISKPPMLRSPTAEPLIVACRE